MGMVAFLIGQLMEQLIMSEEKKEASAEKGEKGDKAADKPPADPAKKKIIIIAAILVADLAIMGGMAFFIVNKLKTKDPTADAAKENAEEEKKKHEEATEMGHVLEKPLALTVNIVSNGSESHYLKCAVQMEWDEKKYPKMAEGMSHRLAKITDIIINILSSQSYADLLKASGKQRIRESIVTEVNGILPEEEGKIRSAFFTEFLVQ